MEKYRDLGGNTNVLAYEIGANYIRAKFSRTSKIYTYSYQKAGNYHVGKYEKVSYKWLWIK